MIIHTSAKASHYNKEAPYYDNFNEKNSLHLNQMIEKTLRKHKTKTVLDLSCGTGSQVFFLAERGYQVMGVDINTKMLSLANAKNKEKKFNMKLIKGDMRTTRAFGFDAVITIFNAIGHLTKQDFNKTLKNIYANLNSKGLYIFDIFNLNYLLADNNITKLTIDWQKKTGNKTIREIQYSTIDQKGILASYDIYHEQINSRPPKISKAFQTLQTYSAKQLRDLLESNGFMVLKQCDVNGLRFSEKKTERILTIAQKC